MNADGTPPPAADAASPTARAVGEVTRGRSMPCPNCRYELRDVAVDRCPECGHRLALRFVEAKLPMQLWAVGFAALCLLVGGLLPAFAANVAMLVLPLGGGIAPRMAPTLAPAVLFLLGSAALGLTPLVTMAMLHPKLRAGLASTGDTAVWCAALAVTLATFATDAMMVLRTGGAVGAASLVHAASIALVVFPTFSLVALMLLIAYRPPLDAGARALVGGIAIVIGAMLIIRFV